MSVFPEPVGSAAMTLAARVGQPLPTSQWNLIHLFEPLQPLLLGIDVVQVRLAHAALCCRLRRDLTSPCSEFNSRSSRTELLYLVREGKRKLCV